jgi:hypothetical protein
MKVHNLSKLRLYITAYINHSNQQVWGYSKANVNSDYYFNQKTIARKTKIFTLHN